MTPKTTRPQPDKYHHCTQSNQTNFHYEPPIPDIEDCVNHLIPEEISIINKNPSRRSSKSSRKSSQSHAVSHSTRSKLSARRPDLPAPLKGGTQPDNPPSPPPSDSSSSALSTSSSEPSISDSDSTSSSSKSSLSYNSGLCRKYRKLLKKLKKLKSSASKVKVKQEITKMKKIPPQTKRKSLPFSAN